MSSFPHRVLVAHPNALVRRALYSFFDDDVEVREASGLAEALAAPTPDALVTALRLHGGDGATLARALRARGTRVAVAVCGRFQEEEVTALIPDALDAALFTPLDEATTLAALRAPRPGLTEPQLSEGVLSMIEALTGSPLPDDPGVAFRDILELAGLHGALWLDGELSQWSEGFIAGRLAPSITTPAGFDYLDDTHPLVADNGAQLGVAVQLRTADRVRGAYVMVSRRRRLHEQAGRAFIRTLRNLLEQALERRGAEEALRGQMRVLQSVFESLPSGVLVVDGDGRRVLSNAAAQELLGREDSPPSFFDPYTFEELPSVEAPLQRALAGQDATDLVLHRHPGSRDVRWLRVSCRPLRNDRGELNGAVEVVHDVTDVQQTEEALHRAHQDFRRAIEHSPDGLCVLREGRVVYGNPALVAALGYPVGQLLGLERFASLVHPDDSLALESLLARVGPVPWREVRFRRQDGSWALCEVVGAPLGHFEGAPALFLVVRDVTERRRMEDDLRQAQKMEAIGQLAGGIAHDFNNIIGAIMVNAQILLEQLDDANPLREDVEEIRESGERAAALTHQLLAFSRRQKLEPRVIDVNGVVRDMERLLRRVIGEHIELKVELTEDLGQVSADPNQLEQVVLNIAINARDAMPSGGRLTIRTSEENHRGGRVVRLALADTGVGMDAVTQARIFEPFFTTKEKGKGTGLGLSTVYGIVEQSGGELQVSSAPGRGTTMSVLLPVAQREPWTPREVSPLEPASSRVDATLLLLEDDPAMRSAVARTLRTRGYKVLPAASESEATELALGERTVHIILTDMVLPGTSGSEAAARLVALHPEARVLYMSGHNEPSLPEGTDTTRSFIGKPFTPQALLQKLEALLKAGR